MTSNTVRREPDPHHGIPQIKPPPRVYTQWRHAHRLCPHQDTHHLVAKRLSNGGTKYYIYCATCGTPTSGSLPHSLLKDVDPTSIPLVHDYSLTAPRCERCGSRGVELHHWAPRALFEDPDCWPTSYLCPECHRKWHRTMRRP